MDTLPIAIKAVKTLEGALTLDQAVTAMKYSDNALDVIRGEIKASLTTGKAAVHGLHMGLIYAARFKIEKSVYGL